MQVGGCRGGLCAPCHHCLKGPVHLVSGCNTSHGPKPGSCAYAWTVLPRCRYGKHGMGSTGGSLRSTNLPRRVGL